MNPAASSDLGTATQSLWNCGHDDAINGPGPTDGRSIECARQESNLRPFAPEANALSPELRAPERTSVAPWRLSARIVTLPLAETFVIARESQDDGEVVEVEVRHGGVSGFGEAAPIERYGESAARRSRWLETVELGDDPWALDEIADGAARRASRRRGPRSTRRSTTCRESSPAFPVYKLLGLRRDGPPTSWTVWLGDPDDMARRAEAAASAGLPAAEAEARRAGRARPRAGAGRPRCDRSAAPGRRQRVLDARRGARATCRRCRSSTASSRCRRATRTAPS